MGICYAGKKAGGAGKGGRGDSDCCWKKKAFQADEKNADSAGTTRVIKNEKSK